MAALRFLALPKFRATPQTLHFPRRCLSSLNQQEVQKFSQISQQWWDPRGPFKPLHAMNPTRVAYLSQMYSDLTRKSSINGPKSSWNQDPNPLQSANILDVGCGGGLLSEALARLGGNVLGIDASTENIKVAQSHAKISFSDPSKIRLEYHNLLAEDLVDQGKQFDVVVSSEVIEHVNNYKQFLNSLALLTKNKGILIISTINRSLLGQILCITVPEQVLGMVPKGTHDFNKFLKPNEISSHLATIGLKVVDVSGLIYNPIFNNWLLANRHLGPFTDIAVQANYILTAVKV